VPGTIWITRSGMEGFFTNPCGPIDLRVNYVAGSIVGIGLTVS